MADGPSAEDAATDLGDGDSRVTRERHKRQDALSSTSLSTGQDAARRVHEDAASFENNNNNNNDNINNNINNNHHHHRNNHLHQHHHHHHHHHQQQHHHHRNSAHHHDDRISGAGGGAGGGDRSCVAVGSNTSTSSTSGGSTSGSTGATSANEEEDDEDDEDVDDADDVDDEDDEDDEDEEVRNGVVSLSGGYRGVGGVSADVTKSLVDDDDASDGSNSNGAGGVAIMIVNATTRCDDAASSADGWRTRPASSANSVSSVNSVNSVSSVSSTTDTSATITMSTSASSSTTTMTAAATTVVVSASPNDVPKVNDREDVGGSQKVSRRSEEEGKDDAAQADSVGAVAGVHAGVHAGADVGADVVGVDVSADIGADIGADVGVGAGAVVAVSVSVSVSIATAVAVAGNGVASANNLATAAAAAAAGRHQGSPFKGQVRMAEDTLVGPCGKKRCADRYDSSESSDSGVAVSCGECSSSGTSDITEPGSPCSTSSDEGVVTGTRGVSASPLPTLPKLAPSSQISTRPQWPWTPPLAATACSTYKRLKGEPEAGALPRSGAADPTSRGSSKAGAKTNAGHHHHHESSQGKITEYFKAQIKPQQSKTKKTSETMSVLVAKSASEFRRPPTVQRNKGGLAKYLGTVSPTGRGTSTNDWEVRTLTMSPPPTKKPPPVIVPRTNNKLDKKLPKPVPSLPISNDVLKNLPSCKISSLRLTSDASPNAAKGSSPPSSPAPSLVSESVPLDFKGCILSKPHVNENNNLTNGCASLLSSLRSQTGQDDLLSRLSIPDDDSQTKESQISPADEEDIEEEEEDSRSSESKPPLSPILSAPTTIRFPARAPEKDRPQATDSGICRWDKCEASFESSGGLLEHLQSAHINTQTGGDNFVCQWQGCKVQGRSSCSRRWLERHVLSHGGNKPFRCIVDGCGSRFSSQTALERHVNGHFNQPETSSSSGRRSCENGGKLVRRNGKRLRYRRQPWSARLFDYFDSGVMEGLQHRLLELAKSRTQGQLAETPGNSMALTSQVLARRVELDGKTKVLLRWYPQDIQPDEWVLESEVQSTKHVEIRKVAASHPDEVSLALYPALNGGTPPLTRVKQRRKPVKNS